MGRVLAVDIGGQGVKTAWFEQRDWIERVSDVRTYHAYDNSSFGSWLARNEGIVGQIVGVSCCGFVDHRSGVVTRSAATGWTEQDVAGDLLRNGAKAAFVINDGEAHLFAHTDEKHPILSISLGTAVGVAVTNEFGDVFRPRIGRNVDAGDMKLVTSSPRKRAWEGLGAEAHDELVREMGREAGTARYGQRVGAFAAQLACLFQPRTVVLSGGLVEPHWPTVERAAKEELFSASPSWLQDVELKRSRHGALAALRGAAGYAIARAAQS
ncbi:MAG: hypothetical protein ACO1SV_07975 [Fimbriimonas sp.]